MKKTFLLAMLLATVTTSLKVQANDWYNNTRSSNDYFIPKAFIGGMVGYFTAKVVEPEITLKAAIVHPLGITAANCGAAGLPELSFFNVIPVFFGYFSGWLLYRVLHNTPSTTS